MSNPEKPNISESDEQHHKQADSGIFVPKSERGHVRETDKRGPASQEEKQEKQAFEKESQALLDNENNIKAQLGKNSKLQSVEGKELAEYAINALKESGENEKKSRIAELQEWMLHSKETKSEKKLEELVTSWQQSDKTQAERIDAGPDLEALKKEALEAERKALKELLDNENNIKAQLGKNSKLQSVEGKELAEYAINALKESGENEKKSRIAELQEWMLHSKETKSEKKLEELVTSWQQSDKTQAEEDPISTDTDMVPEKKSLLKRLLRRK